MGAARKSQSFAARFFLDQLPRHIVQNVEKFAAQHGAIGFHVRGQGSWTVRMGDLEAPVSDDMAEDTELNLWFSAEAFEGFISGTLNIVKAVEQEELGFEGDLALLERFGFLLAPSTTALGSRFNR